MTFGYDWRQSLAECAGYLEDFLTQLKDAVLDRHNEDPLPRTTLLAHSQGGLVMKVFQHRIVSGQAWFDKAITVGTPFYGTSTHQQRYFVGDPLINRLYDPVDVVRVVSSLPGPYSLMYLPKAVFDRDGALIGLDDYPLTEPESGRVVDPYDSDNLDRFPRGVNSESLEKAKRFYIRSFTDPIGQPVDALKREGALPIDPPIEETDLRALVERAAQVMTTQNGRLPTAIDQFGECLLLQNDDAEQHLTKFIWTYNEIRSRTSSYCACCAWTT